MGPDTDTPFTGLRDDYLSSDAFNQRTTETQPAPSKFWQSEALATVLNDLDKILHGNSYRFAQQADAAQQAAGNAPGGRQTGPRESDFAASSRQKAWDDTLRQANADGTNFGGGNDAFAEFLRNMRREAAASSNCPACDHGVAAHTSYGCASCALIRRGCHARFNDTIGDWVFPKL